MTKQGISLTPQVVAAELDVSSATLRRWSDEFADYLSPEAGSTQGRSHRRYNDEDIATLQVVKNLMNDGLTYAQVREELADQFPIWADNSDSATISYQQEVIEENERDDDGDDRDDDIIAEDEEEKSLMNTNGSESSAIDFFANTLATLSDSQKSILNSQAANRELLGVLIQDNFNLKEENNRLRERVLDVERKMTQIRQEDEWRRESLRQELDTKIMNVQQMANQAITLANTPQEAPEIKAVKTKSGCLGALFGGGGDIQIVSMPRRRGRQQEGQGQPQPHQTHSSTHLPTSSAPPPTAHPKPTAPPE